MAKKKGDEHPTDAPVDNMEHFTFHLFTAFPPARPIFGSFRSVFRSAHVRLHLIHSRYTTGILIFRK